MDPKHTYKRESTDISYRIFSSQKTSSSNQAPNAK